MRSPSISRPSKRSWCRARTTSRSSFPPPNRSRSTPTVSSSPKRGSSPTRSWKSRSASGRRAAKLYRRGYTYGIRGLEVSHPGIGAKLKKTPDEAARELELRRRPSRGLVRGRARRGHRSLERRPRIDRGRRSGGRASRARARARRGLRRGHDARASDVLRGEPHRRLAGEGPSALRARSRPRERQEPLHLDSAGRSGSPFKSRTVASSTSLRRSKPRFRRGGASREPALESSRSAPRAMAQVESPTSSSWKGIEMKLRTRSPVLPRLSPPRARSGSERWW